MSNLNQNNNGVQVKRTFYQENGRDTYILNDNGGFNRLQMKIFASNGISRLNNKQTIQINNRKSIDTPMVHHFSDGTGRDQYNHGGLQRNHRYTADVFISTLRSQENRFEIGNQDYFMKSQNILSKKDYYRNIQNSVVQKNLLQRLHYSVEKNKHQHNI